MNILKPIDIEEETRVALIDHLQAYCRPLPEKFTTPCVLISATGGNSSNTIDTFTVTLDARADTAAAAYDTLTTALGILEQQVAHQTGNLRHITINSLANWGTDPVRPDLKLCTATVLITCHRVPITISEES